MVRDPAHVGFTAQIPLLNRDFPARFLEEYHPLVTREDLHACLEYAATGAKLSNFTWADYNRRMDEEEEREKREWLAEWKKKNASNC